MDFSISININKNLYYKKDYKSLCKSIMYSPAINHNQKIDDIFHFGRLAPKMNVYKHCICDVFDGKNRNKILHNEIKKAENANISIFMFDNLSIIKQLNESIMLYLLQKKDNYFVLTDSLDKLDKIIKNINNDFNCNLFDELSDSKNKGNNNFFNNFYKELYYLLNELSTSYKGTNIVKTKIIIELYSLINKIISKINELIAELNSTNFSNKPFKNCNSRYYCEQIKSYKKIFDKSLDGLSIRNAIVCGNGWNYKFNNKPAYNTDSFKFYLIVTKDCVCNFCFTYDLSFNTDVSFDLRNKTFKTFCKKNNNQLEKLKNNVDNICSIISKLKNLPSFIDFNKIFDTSKCFIDDNKIKHHKQNKIYKHNTISNVLFSFNNKKNDKSDLFCSYFISRFTCFSNSNYKKTILEYCYYKIINVELEKCNPIFDSKFSFDTEEFFICDLKTVTSTYRYGTNFIDLENNGSLPHRFRYQAFYDYCQAITTTILSTIATSENLLLGLIATTICGYKKIFKIFALRNFSHIASNLFIRYSTDSSIKRIDAMNIRRIIYDNFGSSYLFDETDKSIKNMWQESNLNITLKCNLFAIAIAFASLFVAIAGIVLKDCYCYDCFCAEKFWCNWSSNPILIICSIIIGITIIFIVALFIIILVHKKRKSPHYFIKIY